jgi:flavin-dependent dehydrogenase
MAAYDVIVVGARCAGSPTAMLLAQKGYRVLLIDRATFPSDTVSTHIVHPLAVAALERWGLRGRLAATRCPEIDTYTFDLGDFSFAGAPGTDSSPVAYCPRRTVLDALLLQAAADSGVDVREGFVVDEVLMEAGYVVGITGHSRNSRSKSTEYAHVVVGADGRNSVVATAVQPQTYNERPPILAIYYAYWSRLPMRGRFESYLRPRRGFGVAETHDGLTMVVTVWPYEEFAANKKDLEGSYLGTLNTVPEFAERLRDARRETRITGAPTPNFFRQPYGPGWTLVGDAGYLKDPITAQGILDAFRDAEACARSLDEALRGDRAFAESMNEYQNARDASAMAMYDFTCGLAELREPSPDMRELFEAMEGQPGAMDGFARMNAGTISPREFLSQQNISAILGRV